MTRTGRNRWEKGLGKKKVDLLRMGGGAEGDVARTNVLSMLQSSFVNTKQIGGNPHTHSVQEIFLAGLSSGLATLQLK